MDSIAIVPGKKRQRNSKTHQRKEQQALNDEEVERALTASLFGSSGISFLSSSSKPKEESLFTFEVDRVGEPSLTLPDNHDENDTDSNILEEDIPPSSSKAAWIDDDDDVVAISLQADRVRKLRTERSETDPLSGSVYQERLRQRFTSTATTTSHVTWAQTAADTIHETENEDSSLSLEEGASISTSLLASPHQRALRPGRIQMKRCPDVNRSDPSAAVLQVVQFHPAPNDPDRPLLLTAGLDKTLRFFQCGEDQSQKVHGVHFPNFPIYSASFLGSTGNVIVTGRRPFFYLFDTVAGKADRLPPIPGRHEKSWERSVAAPDGRTLALLGNDGYILLYDVQQKACRTTQHMKLNGSVRTVCFSENASSSLELFASGSDGDVYRFDIRNSSRCVERFSNLDGTITSSLAASRRTVAVGAESGVVNLYSQHPSDGGESACGQRTPLKSILNLKTSVDAMRYNSDGQLLAISSRREKDALKLVHIPSRTVYRNWPTSQTPLGYVWSMDFSPSSRFLAMGNDQGKCLLYKLLHYDNE